MNTKTLMIMLVIILLTYCTPSQTQPTTVPVLTEAPQANMPNPATAYCEQQGYQVEIRTVEDVSQTGFRVLA